MPSAKIKSARGLIPLLCLTFLVVGITIGYSFGSTTPFVREMMLSESKSLTLSARESMGFFTDIPDVHWIQMKERAHNFDQYKVQKPKFENKYRAKGKQQENVQRENAKFWHLNHIQPSFTCPLLQRIGGNGDGPKWTCDPVRYQHIPDCLIYSVGCNGDYSFEEALREATARNCEMHVFDPGNYARPNDPASKNIHYHQWGLKSSYDSNYAPQVGHEGETVLKTFQETVKELGHENRRINILKIDCEGCEYALYKDMLALDIHQILIEVHGIPDPDGPNMYYNGTGLRPRDFFDAFFEKNYALFSKEVNVHGGGECLEFSFVKLDETFWIDEQGRRRGTLSGSGNTVNRAR